MVTTLNVVFCMYIIVKLLCCTPETNIECPLYFDFKKKFSIDFQMTQSLYFWGMSKIIENICLHRKLYIHFHSSIAYIAKNDNSSNSINGLIGK